jgi:hypothetical protein
MLPPVLELLVSRGLNAEVVSGLDMRPEAAVLAARRLAEARFVLFAGSDPTVLDRARAKLLEGGVAARRISLMPIEWGGPADVVRAIESMGITVPATARRVTMAVSEASFPAPQAIEIEPPRQPLLTGSVAVLDPSATATFGSSRRAIAIASASVGAFALLAIFTLGGDARPEPTLASMVTPPPIAKVVDEEPTIAVAGIVQVEKKAEPVAFVAPVLPPVVLPPPLTIATPATAVPPAPALAVPDEEVAIEAEPELDNEEMKSIYAGLVAQKFRALDILLIAPEPRKKVRKRITKNAARMNFVQAEKYCTALDVNGVTGWRLPRVGELGSVTKNELIADGKFWSQTEGDTFGKSRVVWNTHTSRMGTAPVGWKGGRVVCVRTMAKPVEEAPPAEP